MSTSTKLGDEFLRIPKLEVSGTNWVIFKDRFTWALDARSILDHIDGTGEEPKDPISSEIRAQVLSKPLMFMKIRAKGTAYEIWKELGGHFEKRSRMVSIDLRRRLQELRCADKGDIIEHLSTLRTMRENLASSSYDTYISALNATSSVLGTHLSADDLMLTITEESERRTLKSKGKAKEENAAFHTSDSKKDKKKRKGECHN